MKIHKKLIALDAVALALSQAGTLPGMLDTLLSRIFDSVSGLQPRGGIFLREPDGEKVRLTAQQGLSPEFVRRMETVRLDECLCGQVIITGEVCFAENGCKELHDPHGSDDKSFSHLIVPITSRGIVLGVVFLYPHKEFRLKTEDSQMLEMIGAQLGLAIENLRFYAEVKESSEKYWDLFENARDILFTMDREGRITSANKAAEEFAGYSKAELIGKNALEFLTPESVQTAGQILAGDNPPRIIEFEVIKRDGTHAFVEMSTRKVFKNRVTAGFQVSVRDMTEQKKLRERFVQAERLGAIGQIGVAMRHEINNPLTTVIGNVDLLLERYREKDEDVAERLEVILNNALRIAEIVNRVKEITQDKVVEYTQGVKMTDLKKE